MMLCREYKLVRNVVICISICLCTCISGCISQSGGDYLSVGTPLEFGTLTLFGTDKYLYAMSGKVICINWKGTIIWEGEKLGGIPLIFLGDAFFAGIYDRSQGMGGVALLDLEGQILWQIDLGTISPTGMDASHDLLAVGVLKDALKKHQKGIIWAFSRSGEVLWTYDNPARIDEVCVAPDSSCVVFLDRDNYLHCVQDGKLLWSHDLGKISGVLERRIIAFAPDSSYLVYGSWNPEPSIVACSSDGEKLWSHPINEYMGTVVISDDGQSIIVTSLGRVYKFTPDGNLVWKTHIGNNNDCIDVTPSADHIAVGSNTLISSFIILNGEGDVVFKKSIFDTIWAVAISPDGKYVAFSQRSSKTCIFSMSSESGV